MVAALRRQPDAETAQHRRGQSEQAAEIASSSWTGTPGPGLLAGATGQLHRIIHRGPRRSDDGLFIEARQRLQRLPGY
eukprot:COSAG02_NODE_53422_length_302_cov_0.522167_1_plen_77_part_10